MARSTELSLSHLGGTLLRRRSVALVAAGTASFGCPGPRTPREPEALPVTLTLEPDLGTVRGVAATEQRTFASLTRAAAPDRASVTTVVAHQGEARAWSTTLIGEAGPIAATPAAVAVTLTGTGTVGGAPVRGEPGGMIVGLDPATGRARWQLAAHTDEWVVVTSIAAVPGGFVVGGTFSGSLRLAQAVVTSGGSADGFVARLTEAGEVAWLVRVGGAGPDTVEGVAARADHIAVAGTFVASAELQGHPLPAFDDRSPFPDAFVASLDARGAHQWSATFGGPQADSVVGVAIDARGDVVVAGTARGVVHVGGADLAAQGLADGVLAWWSATGTARHAVLVGGAEFDGLRGITAVGPHVVVSGFFSGTLRLGDRTMVADGGDDAFLAAVDGGGSIAATWVVTGPGREEVSALAAAPGGLVAGIAHTAPARIDDAALPAPADPLAGAALIVRTHP